MARTFHSTSPARRSLVAALLVVACVSAVGAQAVRGHAAGTTVVAGRMTVLHPSQLPPTCTAMSTTVFPEADTYVDQANSGTNYGAASPLLVTARGGRAARTLLRFPLGTAPSGCTLVSATLRVFNASPAPGRIIAVNTAASAWDESTVTYTTMPVPAGTQVDATAAAGWMEWTVTAQVQSLFADGNHGFVLRDTSEGGGTVYTQSFSSRDQADKPELVVQWQ